MEHCRVIFKSKTCMALRGTPNEFWEYIVWSHWFAPSCEPERYDFVDLSLEILDIWKLNCQLYDFVGNISELCFRVLDRIVIIAVVLRLQQKVFEMELHSHEL